MAKSYAATLGSKGTSFYFDVNVDAELVTVNAALDRGDLTSAQAQVKTMAAKVYGNGPNNMEVQAAMAVFKEGKVPKEQLKNASTLTMLEFMLQVGAWYREEYSKQLQERRDLLAVKEDLKSQLQSAAFKSKELELLKTELEGKLASVSEDLEHRLGQAQTVALKLQAMVGELQGLRNANRQTLEARAATTAQLQEAIVEMTTQYQEQRLQLSAVNDEKNQVQGKLASVEQTLATMSTEQDNLKQQLENTRQQLAEATAAMQQLARKMLAAHVRMEQSVESMALTNRNNSSSSGSRSSSRRQLLPQISSTTDNAAVLDMRRKVAELRARGGVEPFKKRLDNVDDVINALQKSFNGNSTIMSGAQKRIMLDAARNLSDVDEDITGAVRIYVRVKPTTAQANGAANQRLQKDRVTNEKSTIKVVDDTSLSISCDLGTPKTYENFFAVYEDATSTEELYGSSAFTPLMDQVSRGYHVVMFGYGASGAGKTFTLLGGERGYGLLQLALTRIPDVTGATLLHAFELYADQVKYDSEARQAHGQVIWLAAGSSKHMTMAKLQSSKGKVVDESGELKLELQYAQGGAGMTSLNGDLKKIDDHRQRQLRTNQKTPNNTLSSRSHLFLTYEIKVKGADRPGFLTVVDMAGREEPLDLINGWRMDDAEAGVRENLKALSTAVIEGKVVEARANVVTDAKGPHTTLRKFLGPKGGTADRQRIVRESVFINESLNHLVYNLQTRMGRQPSAAAMPKSEYRKDRFLHPPTTSAELCMMIPVLEALDQVGRSLHQPTKFVMMCAVEQMLRSSTGSASVACTQNEAVLEFASSISSGGT